MTDRTAELLDAADMAYRERDQSQDPPYRLMLEPGCKCHLHGRVRARLKPCEVILVCKVHAVFASNPR